MFPLLCRLLVVLGAFCVAVPLAVEAADVLAAEIGVPPEKVLKMGVLSFALFLLMSWRPERARGGRSRGRRR